MQPKTMQPKTMQPKTMQYRNNATMPVNSFQQLEVQLKNEVAIYYETHVHKKFLADVYAVIPKGRKCVIWFTRRQCWMFQIAKRPLHADTRNVLYDAVRMIKMPFANESWYSGQGTILYGTCISEKRADVQRRFSVENVHYLCGEKQPDNGALDRFTALFNMYAKETTTTKFSHHFQLFMPIMHTNYNDALRDAMAVTTYDVFCIQHRFLTRTCNEFKNVFIQPTAQSTAQSTAQPTPPQDPVSVFFPKQANVVENVKVKVESRPSQKRVFTIRPDIQNDIYYVLYNPDEPITANTMIAHIPNYKTSVMMNSLFRNIKENRNLDALEESDDENEAQVPLVNLEKSLQMTCVFCHRFKRWQPVGLQSV